MLNMNMDNNNNNNNNNNNGGGNGVMMNASTAAANPIGMVPTVGTPVNINVNASNPLLHPHLDDPSLLNNPIWKLQLHLATVSSQSLGQPNIYARQNAMKKYLATQQAQQAQQQAQQQVQQQIPGQFGPGPQAAPPALQPTDFQQSHIAEASKSLVDCTKQALMEMADTLTDSKTAKKQQPTGDSTPSGTAANSAVSTPLTPKIELFANGKEEANQALLQHKKLSQYSIDEDDDIENRMVMPKDSKYDDQLWHALDLSNLQIFNISPNIFKYNFLTRLYLNGNSLTELPAEIKHLSNLRVLDLSHNRLTSLPAELGSCFQLKYLYFFDNMVTTLPWEFGNLCNLQFLGVEGNPLEKQFLKILTEKSVTGLIFYLRDNRPEIPLPHERRFIEINTDGEPQREYDSLQQSTEHLPTDLAKRTFTVLSYNTLCQHYATPKMYRYTPSWALSWDYRRNKLKEQILSYDSDLLCLQEVESKTFEEYWVPLLDKHGYTGIFHAKARAKTMHSKDSKKVDGCCIFFKRDQFKLITKDAMDFSGAWMKHKKFQRTEDYLNRAMNKDNVALLLKLQHIPSGDSIWAVTTHLHWDPKFNDVKTFQVGVLLDHLETLPKEETSHNFRQDIKKSPVLICGDFNSYINSAVYELISTGRVQMHQEGNGRDFGYMSERNFSHNLALKSSYNCIGELPFTNFTPSFTDVIDYIWFSTHALRVRGLLGEVDPEYVSKFIGFPNDKFPSDHIPLLARFEFMKTNTGSRKV